MVMVDIAMKENIHTIGDHTLRMVNMFYSNIMDTVKSIGSNPINALNSSNFTSPLIVIQEEKQQGVNYGMGCIVKGSSH